MTVCLEGLRPLTSCSEPAVRKSEIRWSWSALIEQLSNHKFIMLLARLDRLC
jgi:hypothetical protein